MQKEEDPDTYTRLFNPKNVTIKIYHEGYCHGYCDNTPRDTQNTPPPPSPPSPPATDESVLNVTRDKSSITDIYQEVENFNTSITSCVSRILITSQILQYQIAKAEPTAQN
jgi:hypothetical protein